MTKPGPAERPQALVVDDDARNLAVLREILEANGVRVVGDATDANARLPERATLGSTIPCPFEGHLTPPGSSGLG